MKVCRLLLFLHRVVVSRPMSLPVSSEMTLAIKLPIEESLHVSLSLFGFRCSSASFKFSSSKNQTYCLSAQSLEKLKSPKRPEREELTTSMDSSHATSNCMAWSAHGLLIQRFSDLCESLAVKKHGESWRFLDLFSFWWF